jgi:hypothetical protein
MSPTATSSRAGSATTVRIRAVSCEPSRDHPWLNVRHEVRAGERTHGGHDIGSGPRRYAAGHAEKVWQRQFSDRSQVHSGRVKPA